MLKRNLLESGKYLIPVPLGIQLELQYSDTGVLEKINLDDNIETISQYSKDEAEKLLYSSIAKSQAVPMHVATNKGTLYVSGVVYTGEIYEDQSGSLPDCYFDRSLHDISFEDRFFNFFATTVKSTSLNFSGYIQMKTWLDSQEFNILPGLLIPYENQEAYIESFINNSQFKLETIVGYQIVDNSTVYYLSDIKRQESIKEIYEIIDASGFVYYIVNTDLKEYQISLYEVLKNKLNAGDSIVVDSNNHMIPLFHESSDLSEFEYTCPVCGKKQKITSDVFSCENSECDSFLYNKVCHFTKKLNLVDLDFEVYKSYYQQNLISRLSDVFNLPEYKDYILQVSLYDLFNAVIPVDSVRNRDDIWHFCMFCKNSVETVNFYMNNPDALTTDMRDHSNELIKWFKNPFNVEEFNKIINYSNIVITLPTVNREFPQIFRGKSIYITGKFKHGSDKDVELILSNFGAKITSYQEAECCIIGDIPENIYGVGVNYIKNKHLPVFTEFQFFNMYDLDSDLN